MSGTEARTDRDMIINIFKRLDALEKRIDRLENIAYSNNDLPKTFNDPELIEDCRFLIRNDQIIEAVKLYRSKTGHSLIGSKRTIESLREAMQCQSSSQESNHASQTDQSNQ